MTGTHLLTADRMPTMSDGLAWTARATTTDDPVRAEAVGACQRTSLGAIGAVEAVRRTFDAAGGIAATQVVARFADARSAWRAHEVLASWHGDCEERLAVPRVEVGRLKEVRVQAGTGDAYRASYGQEAPPRRQASGLGILRAGSYLTLVEITARADDYPDSWNPARVAVRRIARTFA